MPSPAKIVATITATAVTAAATITITTTLPAGILTTVATLVPPPLNQNVLIALLAVSVAVLGTD
jgi:hypothetical protein